MVDRSGSKKTGAWHCSAVLEGHLGAVYDLSSGDRDTLWSVGGDGCLVRWTRQDGAWNPQGMAMAKADEALFCVRVLPNGEVLAGGASGGLIAWTNAGVEILGGHPGGTFVVTDQWSAGADGHLRRWRTGESVGSFPGRIRCVLDTRRGTRVGLHDGHAAILGSASPQSLHDGSVRAMMPWPGKGALGTAGADGRIRIWEEVGDTLRDVVSIDAHKGAVYRLKASPDGLRVASASRDRTVAVWNASDLALEARLSRSSGEGHTRSVNALCWLDDHTIATGGDDRRILLWERRSD